MENPSVHLKTVIELAAIASQEILRIRETSLLIQKKPDGSPVTNGDLRAHKILQLGLEKLALGQVISEEGELPLNLVDDLRGSAFWLVDPLDGTRDYISGESGFAICIAHMVDEQPVLAVLGSPIENKVYFAERGKGAFEAPLSDWRQSKRLQHPRQDRPLIAGASRSSASQVLKKVYEIFGVSEVRPFGSALKFAFLARGDFDIYPRLGMTYEWDTASGQLIAEEAGCSVIDMETLQPLKYCKRAFENDGGFLALRSDLYDAGVLAQLRDLRRRQVVARMISAGEGRGD